MTGCTEPCEEVDDLGEAVILGNHPLRNEIIDSKKMLRICRNVLVAINRTENAAQLETTCASADPLISELKVLQTKYKNSPKAKSYSSSLTGFFSSIDDTFIDSYNDVKSESAKKCDWKHLSYEIDHLSKAYGGVVGNYNTFVDENNN